MKLNLLAASAAAATSLMLAGAAQAASLVVDDWKITTGDEVIVDLLAPTANPIVTPDPRTTTGGTSLTRREMGLYLNPTGQNARATDCVGCQQAELSTDVNSVAHAYWHWSSSTQIDLADFTSIDLAFSSDRSGLDVIFSFFDGSTYVGERWIKEMPDTDTDEVTLSYAMNLTGKFTNVYMDMITFAGVYDDTSSFAGRPDLGSRDYGKGGERYDVTLSNVTMRTPEPSSLALVGLTLAGLGFMRRRRA